MLGEGKSIAEVAKALEVSEPTYHRWRNQYGGMKADDAKRLKELEREIAQLKRIVADQALREQALKELAKGNFLSPARRRRAVLHLQERFGVSERWACQLVGQHRSHPSPPARRRRRRRSVARVAQGVLGRAAAVGLPPPP